MAGPLLETKLHVPRRRRGLVARSRLTERLSRGTESALTLVSAPAGFGKTTLLADWLTTVLNLLVVIAGFVLLVTGQYPRAMFDLLVGINRWLYRVLTYVGLMRDVYPPFRLDQGAYEPRDADYPVVQRTRFTGPMATAPRMAQTPATEYSTP